MAHWQSLSVFAAVAEEGSFSGAAKRLDLTQPTVSFHIDNLEKALGCPLLQRTAKGASLTAYGQFLYENTRKASDLLAATESQLQAMLAGAAGQITLGASTIPAEYILPGLIAAFQRSHPGLRFTLRTGDSRTTLEAFNAGEVPIAVIGNRPDDALDPQPLWRDELVLVAHPAVRARLGGAPSLAQALSLPLAVRSLASGSMQAVLAALSTRGITAGDLDITLEVGGNEALKAAILSQAGPGFISRWAVAAELAAGSLVAIPLPGLTIHRQFYAIARQPLAPTCMQVFWEYLLASESGRP
jgi:DNA-binding transcriptional LysR family regulator